MWPVPPPTLTEPRGKNHSVLRKGKQISAFKLKVAQIGPCPRVSFGTDDLRGFGWKDVNCRSPEDLVTCVNSEA